MIRLLEEKQRIYPGVSCIMKAHHSLLVKAMLNKFIDTGVKQNIEAIMYL